jgi:hypothetical protein
VSTTPQRDLLHAASASAASHIEATGSAEDEPVVVERTASLAASGDVASSGQFWSILEASAALAASGAFASQALRQHHRSSALAATGAISTVTEHDFLRSAALTASGDVAVSGDILRTLERAGSLSATGTITTTLSLLWSYGPYTGWSFGPFVGFAYVGGSISTYTGTPGYSHTRGTAATYSAGADWSYGD